MILHAVSMIVLLAEQAKQTQCLVQCASNSIQDPLWGRLLLSAIPSIFALGIAWLAFHWSSTQGNKQWIRDQKKVEWKEINSLLADVWDVLHPILRKEELDKITHGSLFEAVRKLRSPLLHPVFIVRPFASAEFREKFDRYLLKVAQRGNELKAVIEDLRSVEPVAGITYTPEERASKTVNAFEDRERYIKELTEDFLRINETLREMMAGDLRLGNIVRSTNAS